MIIKRYYKVLFLFFYFLIIESNFASNILEKYKTSYMCVNKKKICFKLKVADTEEKRRIGLMHIKSMDNFDGMIFLYGSPSIVNIWMLNTFVNLDLVFLKDQIITKIVENAEPCLMKPCRIYSHDQSIDSLLELKAGYVSKYNLLVGDKVYSF
tara:strand:+ start:156 stop:614 length:459 start_codon:yes stop_codon:yes gene_type:complete